MRVVHGCLANGAARTTRASCARDATHGEAGVRTAWRGFCPCMARMSTPSLAERAYAASPIWLQNVLISAYGAHLRRQRYGAEQRRNLAAIRATPEGHRVGRLDPVFKAVSSLSETRIVQDASDHVRVEMVCEAALAEGELATLRRGLHDRLGPSMRIEFVRLPRLERSSSGKSRSVVNLMASRPEGRPSTRTG